MAGGLIEQYMAIKKEHEDAILFFQVGNFYQLYYYDAEIGQKECGFKLKLNTIGGKEKVPVCGFPVSSERKYRTILNEKGYCVAVCSQSDKKDETGKYIRNREVTSVSECGANCKKQEIRHSWHEFMECLEENLVRIASETEQKKETIVKKSSVEQEEEIDVIIKSKCVDGLKSQQSVTEQKSYIEDQMIMSKKNELWEQLKNLELHDVTPMHALILLYTWKKRYILGKQMTEQLQYEF